MAFIADTVFDTGLAVLTANATRIDITSQEATTYSEAVTDATYSLGNKTGLTVGAATAGDTDGRKVVVPAITDGTVTETATATHWALTDGTSVLYATGPLTASQAVTDTNTFTLDAIDITIRDATAV